MVSPNNTINYVPPDDDSEQTNTENQRIAPVKPTDQTQKDFKKVLTKGAKTKGDKFALKKSPAKIFEPKIEEAQTTDDTAEIDEDPDQEVEIKPEKDDEENAAKGAPVSLFDLPKDVHAKETPKETPAKTPIKEVANVESPSDLFKRMSSSKVPKKEFKAPGEPVKMAKEVKEPAIKGSSVVDTGEAKKEKFTSRYDQEQPDIVYVNPMAAAPHIPMTVPVTSSPKVERPMPIDPNMQLFIEHVIKQMYTVETSGKTETVLVLQHPPIFQDAKIVVSAYDNAKGQYNISFENLTQAAQKILDRQENRKSLIAALELKGYNVQNISTTTVQIQNLAVADPQRERGDEEQKGGQQQQQQQQQRRQRDRG